MNLVEDLRKNILPESFDLNEVIIPFESPEMFSAVADTPDKLMSLVLEHTGVTNGANYVDTFESGFLGALALSLWFMEFDENNWFTFQEIHKVISGTFQARAHRSHRLELRLVKGEYPPMMLDQPVILDYRDLSISFISGKLRD